MNPILPLLGRVLISAMFLIAGYNKLMAVAGTAAYFGKLGFPMPEIMVWLTILIEIGGGLLFLIGWKTRWISALLVVFVVIASFMGHRFWVDPGQLNAFLKNMAIIGGLLMYLTYGPGSASVDRR